MLNNDKFQKFYEYIRPGHYWSLTDQHNNSLIYPTQVKRYPLNCTSRLISGHYSHFDDAGLPIRFDTGRQPYHNVTTVCSYALAHWDLYYTEGRSESASVLIQAANLILHLGQSSDDGALLVCDDRPGVKPHISAMNQGEAISVLTRAWELTGDDKYLESARAFLLPFTHAIEEDGVRCSFSWEPEIIWFEEYTTQPVRHVLNGMIYALWGIRDLMIVADDGLAEQLWHTGTDAVRKSLKYFDMGDWSSYCVIEPGGKQRIASAMYHNLHIVQLQALYQQTGIADFERYAQRFAGYSQQGLNRLRAGFQLMIKKMFS